MSLKKERDLRHRDTEIYSKKKQKLEWWVYMPKSAGSHQKLGERHGIASPSEHPEGINPADILISNCKSCFKATNF